MTYKEKLLDPRWQRKKNLILERDNYRCTYCTSTHKNLQVHHLEYFSCDPWDYPNDMLITLCCVCHDKENGREHLEKGLATSLKMNGFLAGDLLALSTMLYSDMKFTHDLLKCLRKFQDA